MIRSGAGTVTALPPKAPPGACVPQAHDAAASRRGWPYVELSTDRGGTAAATATVQSQQRAVEVRAIPCCAWAKRGPTSMRVWVRRNSAATGAESGGPAKALRTID
ncbi:MAG: hypothetical protein ACLQCU_15035 [Acidimicrobiales bacterium]